MVVERELVASWGGGLSGRQFRWVIIDLHSRGSRKLSSINKLAPLNMKEDSCPAVAGFSGLQVLLLSASHALYRFAYM